MIYTLIYDWEHANLLARKWISKTDSSSFIEHSIKNLEKWLSYKNKIIYYSTPKMTFGQVTTWQIQADP